MNEAMPPATGSRWLGRRYLFRVGKFKVPSYAATLYVGFVLGTTVGGMVVEAAGLNVARFNLAAVLLLVPALVGGWLWPVMQNPQRMVERLGSLRAEGRGAGGLYGGLVASFIVSVPVLQLLGLDFWRFWDGGAVLLLVGMTVTRFGCLMTGCCAGRETQSTFGMWAPDHTGRWRCRFPTQLFEAGWSALILLAELLLRTRLSVPGVLFLTAAAAYGAGRLGLELLREGASTAPAATRINLGFSALLILLTTAVLPLRCC